MSSHYADNKASRSRTKSHHQSHVAEFDKGVHTNYERTQPNTTSLPQGKSKKNALDLTRVPSDIALPRLDSTESPNDGRFHRRSSSLGGQKGSNKHADSDWEPW